MGHVRAVTRVEAAQLVRLQPGRAHTTSARHCNPSRHVRRQPDVRGGGVWAPGLREGAGTRLSRSGQVPGPTAAGSRRTYVVSRAVVESLAELNTRLAAADAAEDDRRIDGRAQTVGEAFTAQAPLLAAPGGPRFLTSGETDLPSREEPPARCTCSAVRGFPSSLRLDSAVESQLSCLTRSGPRLT